MNYLPPVYRLLPLFLLLFLTACSSSRVTYSSPAFSIATNQKMMPVQPFGSTLVPARLSDSVFNEFIDGLNDSQATTGISWFGIVKDDIKELEKSLPGSHVFLNGELWSYIENSGCCATELRIKSRLRIYRVQSRELLWEAEFPLEGFFEHDNSTIEVEREKLGRRLSSEMIKETSRALSGARKITVE